MAEATDNATRPNQQTPCLVTHHKFGDWEYTVRPYQPSDRQAVRLFAAEDEFERPELYCRYPRMGQWRADGTAYSCDLEPESLFIAESNGEFIGALFGAADSETAGRRADKYVCRLRRRRLLLGAYGIPIWLIPMIRTNRAPRLSEAPQVDPARFPAELHMGVKGRYRRRGIGSALVAAFEAYLRSRGVPGYHVYVSSYHEAGVSFYRKIGLEELGQFQWRFHDGFNWLTVTEHVFVRDLRSVAK